MQHLRRFAPTAWPDDSGSGGRMVMEQVAGCTWIRWQNGVEYANRYAVSRSIVRNLSGMNHPFHYLG